MPNGTSRRSASDIQELHQQAFRRPGTDPLAVKSVRGQRTYALPGFGFSRAKFVDPDADPPIAADDAEPLPAAQIADPRTAATADRARLFDLRQFSAAGFYLEFLDADGAPVALDNTSTVTVTAWRRQDNGDMVRGPVFAAVGHRIEQTDDTVIGRYVLYQITDIALVDATTVRLRVAGEGIGFVE